MALSKLQRAAVFAMFDGHCAYCGIVLTEKGWHADHVEPIYRQMTYVKGTEGRPSRFVHKGACYKPENERNDNYFPACRRCNLHKSNYGLEDWRRYLERSAEILRNNYSTFRAAERFNLVAVAETKVVFYFEKFAPAPPVEPKETL